MVSCDSQYKVYSQVVPFPFLFHFQVLGEGRSNFFLKKRFGLAAAFVFNIYTSSLSLGGLDIGAIALNKMSHHLHMYHLSALTKE